MKTEIARVRLVDGNPEQVSRQQSLVNWMRRKDRPGCAPTRGEGGFAHAREVFDQQMAGASRQARASFT